MCLPPTERSGQPRVLGLLCLGYAASMLAFRPTLTLLLPTLTKEHGLRLEDAGLPSFLAPKMPLPPGWR